MLDHNAPNFLFFLEYSFHFFCWRVCESFHCVCVYYRKERANVTILMGLIWLRFNLTVLKWRHFGHICSATLESYCCSNHCSKCTTAIQLFHTRKRVSLIPFVWPVCEVLFSFLLYPEPLFASDSWRNGIGVFAVNLLISRGPYSQSFGRERLLSQRSCCINWWSQMH